MKRPEGTRSNSQAGQSLKKIGQKKIALADAMPFDELTKNAIASQKIIYSDGSSVRTRRDLGGIDRIWIETPEGGKEETVVIEKEKRNYPEFFFAIQIWETSSTANEVYAYGYAIATISEEHELKIIEVVPYPEYSEKNKHSYYTSIYSNQANVGYYWSHNPSFNFNYRWLQGANNEKLFVDMGDHMYWELDPTGYWYMATDWTLGERTYAPTPDAPCGRTGYDFPNWETSIAKINYIDTECLSIKEDSPPYAPTDETEKNLEKCVEFRAISTCDLGGYVAADSWQDFAAYSAIGGETFGGSIPYDEETYSSRDGITYSTFYQIDNWSDHIDEGNGRGSLTEWGWSHTYGLGTDVHYWGYPGGEENGVIEGINPNDWTGWGTVFQNAYDYLVTIHQNWLHTVYEDWGTSWDGRCGPRYALPGYPGTWIESNTCLGLEGYHCEPGTDAGWWTCVPGDIDEFTCGVALIFAGPQVVDPFNSIWIPVAGASGHDILNFKAKVCEYECYSRNVQFGGELTSKLYIDSFGITEEVVGIIPTSFYTDTITSKYYDPSLNSDIARFAGSAKIQTTDKYGSHYSADDEYPEYIFLTYSINHPDPALPTIRYCIIKEEDVKQSVPYFSFKWGDKTYYSDGNCFWGEKIPTWDRKRISSEVI